MSPVRIPRESQPSQLTSGPVCRQRCPIASLPICTRVRAIYQPRESLAAYSNVEMWPCWNVRLRANTDCWVCLYLRSIFKILTCLLIFLLFGVCRDNCKRGFNRSSNNFLIFIYLHDRFYIKLKLVQISFYGLLVESVIQLVGLFV